MDQITNEEARDFLVSYQDLNGQEGTAGYEGAERYMRKARCIQFDPLNVVGRNPDLVLQARVKDYRPEILEKMLYRDRILMDGFDKELSIIMSEDYPEMTRVRKAATETLIRTLTYRGSLEALDILNEVREYIRQNGPQPAGRIDIGGRAQEGRWGHKKLSSAALDYLYHSGQLGINRKIRTQKVYDLSERLYPKEILQAGDPFRTDREFLKWYIKKRIGSIGLVWNRKTGAWLGEYLQDSCTRTEILRELTEEGELLAFGIEGSGETFYMRKGDAAYLRKGTENNRAAFIAPLDNLIWDRAMTETVFRFRYSWEVYTPAAKRQYGYYVLPVLYRNRFIARFEPERNDGKEPLRIKGWWWEPDVTITDDMMEAVGDAFRHFSRYLGVEMMKDRYWKRIVAPKRGKGKK